MLGLTISIAMSSELSQEELDKRKIVSRFYQASYGTLQICPDKEAKEFLN